VCDLETSRMGAPYIYDISRLRVKAINLTHVTTRKQRHRVKHGVLDFHTVCRVFTRGVNIDTSCSLIV
jgi:hypothetical protein